MMIVACLGTLAILFAGNLRNSIGFGLGAGLAILNYRWLHDVIESLFDRSHARVPPMVIAKFGIRYPLAIATVLVFYKTGWLPFVSILAGLFVPVCGVLVEAVFQIREGILKS